MGIDVAATGKVIVVTGVGGMGRAIARRMGAGATLLLADYDEAGLRQAGDSLRSEGYDVVDQQTDVSDGEAVRKLAQRAVELGRPEVVVHTAGVAPARASVDAILRVDLLGTALMLEVFGEAIAFGGAGVFIASMAGTMAPSNPNLDELLAKTPARELLDRGELSMDVISEPETAYMSGAVPAGALRP